MSGTHGAKGRYAVIHQIESVLLVDDYFDALVRMQEAIQTETDPGIKADAEAVARRMFERLVF